ncbi:uncharacterized protein LOC124259539 [Haliotis rubra]|uniref:uncharacterized protein LOC124259539 n=1 Tax=Haliotis rubra TaxID=36100 RepID=UPI001EE56C6E|nr:uncharacterized protein LOC124259539 [Haliotis rubra]
MRCPSLYVAMVITMAIAPVLGQHGWDTTVCTQLTVDQNDATHKRPNLPKQFSVRVEANILDKNYTTDIREWYDEVNNKGAIDQFEQGVEAIAIYDYDLNELIVVIPMPDSSFHCTVTDLAQDPNRFIFGAKTYANGTDRIYTAAGALRFGGSTPEKYIGIQTVRGVLTDTWQSCVYWADMDATMTVLWHFSRVDWQTSQDTPQVPVRCHVTGKIWNGTVSRNFEHIYEFAEYRNSLDGETERFETPQGAYCHGMKTRTKPPTPSNTFSFGAEVQVPEAFQISYMTEYFDHDNKLVKLEYTPSNLEGPGADKHRTTEIHDFNTGISYIRDEINNNCSVGLIASSGFDAETSGPTSVRMRSSSEFFFTNKTDFIAYEGLRTMRGIECDVWITDKVNWPVGSAMNTTWEWYFARQEWQDNTGNNFESQMPVGIIITMHMQPVRHYIYNIYDYNEEPPVIWSFDIGKCYNSTEKQFQQFLLQGNFTKDVLSDEMGFKTWVIQALVAYLSVSPLRISNIDVDHSDKYIKVAFYLLGPTPFQGDIPNFPNQIPLATAVQSLTNGIKQSQLTVTIEMGANMNVIRLTAIPYSDKLWGFTPMTAAQPVTSQPDDEPEDDPVPEVDPALPEVEPRIYKRSVPRRGLRLSAIELCEAPAEGYSGGALAGIAIGMLTLGFLVCFGAILLGSKYGRRAARSQGYEMQ